MLFRTVLLGFALLLSVQGQPRPKPKPEPPVIVKPWTKFSHWKEEWLKGPHVVDVNYDTKTEITITDDENKTERFEVFIDGTSVGKTSDFEVDRDAHCGNSADLCIKYGWSHGTFPIPPGQHKVSIKLIGKDIDGGWYYFGGQYKIATVAKLTHSAEFIYMEDGSASSAMNPWSINPWTKFIHRKAEWLEGPHEFNTNYDFATEITVTDDENKTERFEVFVDGVSVGKTSDFIVDHEAHCGSAADLCIENGWGHGTFSIPAGQHNIAIKLIGKDIDGGWGYFGGQYKISRKAVILSKNEL